jgi:hypothetical protein
MQSGAGLPCCAQPTAPSKFTCPKLAGPAIGLASVELAPNGSAHFCLHSLEILSLEGWGDETLRPSCPPSKEENEQH